MCQRELLHLAAGWCAAAWKQRSCSRLAWDRRQHVSRQGHVSYKRDWLGCLVRCVSLSVDSSGADADATLQRVLRSPPRRSHG